MAMELCNACADTDADCWGGGGRSSATMNKHCGLKPNIPFYTPVSLEHSALFGFPHMYAS
jgi:hypothetical protein